MQAAILAGGLGTRLRPLTNMVPKAMVPVNGRPFLEYEIELLKSGGVDEIVLCVGYLGDLIREHFGDGSKFGVDIRYSSEGDRLLGPIGGLKMAESKLRESFFVTYGDAYLRLDFHEMMKALLERNEQALMAVYRNENRFGKSDVVVEGGFVEAFDKVKTAPEMHWINYGVTAMKREALDRVSRGMLCDEMTFYGGLLKDRQLRAFEVRKRFYEIGSEYGLREFKEFVLSNIGRERAYETAERL